jgi:pyrimidine oxygenase
MECLEDIALGYTMNPNVKDVSAVSMRRAAAKETRSSVSPGAIVGSYDSIAIRLARAVVESELDGIILIVPDYVKDLDSIARKSLARMASHGVTCRIQA